MNMKLIRPLHHNHFHLHILSACGVMMIGVFVFAIGHNIQAMMFSPAGQGAPAMQTEVSSENPTIANAELSRMPVFFEPNLGQANKKIDFVAHKASSAVSISSTTLTVDSHVQHLVNSNVKAKGVGDLEQESVSNYFMGSDSKKWLTEIPNYQQVVYRNVYPKIDIEYSSENGQLNYQFVVAPGGDPSKIELALDDASSLSLNDGSLSADTATGKLSWENLQAYQVIDGTTVPVDASFALRGKNGYAFTIGKYNGKAPLIIDPTMTLEMGTFIGGTGNTDTVASVVVDSDDNIYLGGQTNSTNFPTSSAYQSSLSGTQDGYIVKLNPAATAIEYSTYFGGSGDDRISGIRLDSNGNVLVSGTTDSTNLPTLNAYQSANAGSRDIFVAKFNPTASTLAFSTYLGGSGTENFSAYMQLDSSDTIYITAASASSNFPTMNAFQSTYGGGTSDAVIAKFNSSGSLLYSTYLGGNGNEGSAALLTVDGSGNMYVSGSTASTNFPTMNPYQAANAGLVDSYLVKLNPAGDTMIFGTYFGGTRNDSASGGGNPAVLAADGNIFIGGYTDSTNLPVTTDAIQHAHAADGGDRDLFISEFNSTGSALVYSTYLGGNHGENAMRQMHLDANGELAFVAQTLSTNMPTANAIQSSYGGGGADWYIGKLVPGESTLRFGSYLGGTGTDIPSDFVFDSGDDMVVGGSAGSSNFPTTPDVIQPTLSGTSDGFVAKLSFTEDPMAQFQMKVAPQAASASASADVSAPANSIGAMFDGMFARFMKFLGL